MRDWREYVRRHLRLDGFRPEREAEIVEEVARQMEDAYAEALREGENEARAAEIARRHISDWEALANALAEAHRGKEPIMTQWQQRIEARELETRRKLSWFTGWRRDVIYGLRQLAKNPGFAVVAVLTLALCIGANTALFSVINTVMFKALPVRDPNHLMLLEWAMRSGPKLHSHSSYGDCDNQREGNGGPTDARYRNRFSTKDFLRGAGVPNRGRVPRQCGRRTRSCPGISTLYRCAAGETDVCLGKTPSSR
jgi:hypothetical protein